MHTLFHYQMKYKTGLRAPPFFSTLDLQSGYWQLPVCPSDQAKTAFCPGPGMGLYEFKRMPFGLTGAPSSFQQLMDKVLRGLPFVTIYLDDILIHSATTSDHISHLRSVFTRLSDAGLTLKGRKCHLGLKSVTYLGHTFSTAGMSPDPKKVESIRCWPTPTTPTEVRQFLGLASYYRRYIPHFSTIAAPLNTLTQKNVPFDWKQECVTAFASLKSHLAQAPVLKYPQFEPQAGEFKLHTDASAYGAGAVLEQDGHVIAYASRALTSPEKQYSTIQRECLAVVYALKQFRHYLLGRHFQLVTDHAPLQWLSTQKMQGLLCRWALAMQEYDFTISYCKGALNTNADALSRRPPSTCAAAIALPHYSSPSLRQAQEADPTLSIVISARGRSTATPTSPEWKRYPLWSYKRVWSQLQVVDNVLCRQYTPAPLSEMVAVPILPPSLRQAALARNHDAPTAGHQGFEHTLSRIKQEAYWVSMAKDVERHCRECTKCQQSRVSMPQRAPLKYSHWPSLGDDSCRYTGGPTVI